MTNGFGAMYSYAARVEPADRWRIAAYIRVLQLSRNATMQRRAGIRARETDTAIRAAVVGSIHGAIAMSLPNTLPDNVRLQIDRAQRRGLAFGVVGLIATVALAFGLKDWTQFFHSYLLAYVFWMVFAMGCMAILQLHHMTGGRWGLPIRRILEAGTRTIPAMTVLFVPVLFGMSRLYPWMQPDSLGDDPAGHFRRVYLEPHFFIVRAVIYFAIWNLLAALLNKWSARAGPHRGSDPKGADVEPGCSGHGALGNYVVLGDGGLGHDARADTGIRPFTEWFSW